MKIFVALCLILLMLSGCVVTPKKFSRAKYSAVDREFTKPFETHLTQVKGLPKKPYDSVCRQQVARENWWGLSTSDRTSSSAYLDGGVLLTAGHNFGDSLLGFSSASEFHLECQTGYASLGNEFLVYDNFQKASSSLEYIHPDYSFTFAFLDKKFGRDAALVKLCPLASANKSAFRLASLSEIDSFVQSANSKLEPIIFVAGYPHGKSSPSSTEAINGEFDGSRLMHVKTSAKQVSDTGVIRYSFSNTVSGMSGGPVWIENDTPGGMEYVIVGVHVTNGGAFLIDKTIIDEYAQMRQQSCQ